MKENQFSYLLIFACFFCSNWWVQANSDVKSPNIIFVMIDDCSAVEFSTYATESHPSGNNTPVIDALAEEGLKFTSCWATPLCMPTRALLMSGKYGYKTGVYGNKLNRPTPNFAAEHKPISKVLKEKGYETAISGKWHCPGFAAEETYGWDEYSLLGGYMTPYKKDIIWDGLWFSWSEASRTFLDTAIIGKNRGKYPALYWHGAVIENGELLPSDASTYAPDLCQEFALNFISKKRNKPFFLYYPMVLPHDPWLGTPDPDNPGKRTKPGFTILINRTEYYMDELISTLKDEGIFENTLLIFTADNATLGNGKGSCSELGVRVPLLIAGGPLKNKGVSNALIDFSDMYPTLMEVAGIDESEAKNLDGKSFYPLLKNERYREKKYIFSYLDMERTIRNKTHMMDGSGGVWKCAADGNVLDYQLMPESSKTDKIRNAFLKEMEQYTLPSEEKYGKERIKSVTGNYQWPSPHYSMKRAIQQQNEWMDNPRRAKE